MDWNSVLGGGVIGVVVTAIVGYLTARHQVGARAERIREGLENEFGNSRRAVYEEFDTHLKRFNKPSPVPEAAKEIAGEVAGEGWDWEDRFKWEHTKLISRGGPHVRRVINKYDFAKELTIMDPHARDELSKAMHKDMFPRDYTLRKRLTRWLGGA